MVYEIDDVKNVLKKYKKDNNIENIFFNFTHYDERKSNKQFIVIEKKYYDLNFKTRIFDNLHDFLNTLSGCSNEICIVCFKRVAKDKIMCPQTFILKEKLHITFETIFL